MEILDSRTPDGFVEHCADELIRFALIVQENMEGTTYFGLQSLEELSELPIHGDRSSLSVFCISCLYRYKAVLEIHVPPRER